MELTALVADLKSDEGWRDRPYRDHLGFLTVGYGFLIDERKSIAMPLEVGELWLSRLAHERVTHLNDRLPWLKNQPDDVQRALANMAYQMGVNGVLAFRRMLNALTSGGRIAAAREALDSTWAKEQTPERAQRIANLIRGNGVK